MLIILLYVAFLIISIGIHEFAHAWAADRLGDPTARAAGRLTLNPFAHIDLLGTVILPFSLILLSSVSGINFVFGWGKPTPFDPYNLKNPRRDSGVIALAGPVSNMILATLAAIAANFLPYSIIPYLTPLILTNVSLAIFNLLPVGPLDGQKILLAILPRDLAYEFQSIMSRYGTIILILLIFPIFGREAPITAIMHPIILFFTRLLLPNL